MNDHVSQQHGDRSRTPKIGAAKSAGHAVGSHGHSSRTPKDPVEAYGDKLKHMNGRLRRLLRDLNHKVEFAIERFNTKKLAEYKRSNEPDIDKQHAVKDRELNIAQQ